MRKFELAEETLGGSRIEHSEEEERIEGDDTSDRGDDTGNVVQTLFCTTRNTTLDHLAAPVSLNVSKKSNKKSRRAHPRDSNTDSVSASILLLPLSLISQP